jgi:hypothetical protein
LVVVVNIRFVGAATIAGAYDHAARLIDGNADGLWMVKWAVRVQT